MDRAKDIWEKARWPVIGSRWLHVKSGNVYQVTGKALREADLEPVVTYTRSDAGWHPAWVRPLSEFLDGRFSPC